jgi:hypothetical protein
MVLVLQTTWRRHELSPTSKRAIFASPPARDGFPSERPSGAVGRVDVGVGLGAVGDPHGLRVPFEHAAGAEGDGA